MMLAKYHFIAKDTIWLWSLFCDFFLSSFEISMICVCLEMTLRPDVKSYIVHQFIRRAGVGRNRVGSAEVWLLLRWPFPLQPPRSSWEKIMLNQYKAIISTHCSEYQADREGRCKREGWGWWGMCVCVCVWERERERQRDRERSAEAEQVSIQGNNFSWALVFGLLGGQLASLY